MRDFINIVESLLTEGVSFHPAVMETHDGEKYIHWPPGATQKTMGLRDFIDIVESSFSSRSFGWWIWPDGKIEECPDEGTHVDLAYQGGDQDPDDAIDDMLQKGAIRVATFHGSDEMNINFNPHTVKPRALRTMRRLLIDTRGEYIRYFFDDVSQKTRSIEPLDYRAAITLVSR